MAREHKPEPWESGASGPFLMMNSSRGQVAVRSLGGKRFPVTAPGHDQEVVGFDTARATAGQLARRTSSATPTRRSRSASTGTGCAGMRTRERGFRSSWVT